MTIYTMFKLNPEDKNFLKQEKFENREDLKNAISECFEQYWEDNYDLHTTNKRAYNQAVEQIEKLTDEFIKENNITF